MPLMDFSYNHVAPFACLLAGMPSLCYCKGKGLGYILTQVRQEYLNIVESMLSGILRKPSEVS